MNLRIYALVVALAAAGLGVALWQARTTNAGLAAQVTRLSRQNAELRYELKQARTRAEEFTRRAIELDTQLGSAKTRTTATESRQARLTRELTEREQREVALMAELAALRQQVAAAAPRGEVAAAPAGARAPAGHSLGDGRTPPANEAAATPEPTTDAARRRIVELEQQLTQLLTRALAEPVPAPAGEPEIVTPPEPYQVVRVGPRDSFVVLDFGAAHGAQPGHILGLWRGTSEVARVQISETRPRFSLAQVLAASLKGQLQTGDLALLTH